MSTIGQALERHKGLGPGFDLLRVALAVSIVAWHSVAVVSGQAPDQQQFLWFPGYAIITAFFSLSGFLIAGSASRLRLPDFLTNRGMRIFPALFVEIVLSAFVLGPIFTRLVVSVYFRSAGTWLYFTNVIGVINYHLPGVFEKLPTNAVNWSLWTVPHELACYALISGLMITGSLRRPVLVVALFTGLIASGLLATSLGHGADHRDTLSRAISPLLTGNGSRLYAGFLMGIATYLFRDRIPFNKNIAVACVFACLLVSGIGPRPWMTMPFLNAVAAPLIVYLTVFLGTSNLPKLPFFHRGDYSYGIYLYGAPVQQAVFSIFPIRLWWLQFILALPVIVTFSAFSWHLIEKRVLKLRKRFSFVARVRGVEGPCESVVGASPGNTKASSNFLIIRGVRAEGEVTTPERLRKRKP